MSYNSGKYQQFKWFNVDALDLFDIDMVEDRDQWYAHHELQPSWRCEKIKSVFLLQYSYKHIRHMFHLRGFMVMLGR